MRLKTLKDLNVFGAIPTFLYRRANLTLSSVAVPNEGTWVQKADYIYATVLPPGQNTTVTSAIFALRFSKGGNFSITLNTIGCKRDSDCATRGRIWVTVDMQSPGCGGSQQEETRLSQTNEQDKYDEIYNGWMPATSSNFVPTIFLRPFVYGQTGIQTMVASSVTLTMLGEKEADATLDECGRQRTDAPGTGNNATGTNAPAQSNSPTGSTGAKSISLTSGARAGIGVGAALLALFMLLATVLVWRGRQRKKNADAALKDWSDKPELEANDVPRHQWLAESHEGEIREMSSSAKPVELEGDVVAREMPVCCSESAG